MDSGLTLSPVINLFHVLTPADKPASPPNVLERLPLQKERASLGDFTRLWNFLGHEPPTRTTTPATPLGLPSSAAFSSKFPPAVLETIDATSDGNRTASSTPSSPPNTPPSPIVKNVLQTPRKDPKKVKFTGVRAASSPLLPTSGKQQRQLPRKVYEAKEIKVTIDGHEVTWEERPAIAASLPIITRRMHLMQKLMQQFPDDFRLTATTTIKPDIHVFIDNSNILIGFMDYIKVQRGYTRFQRIQRPAFSFFHLRLILERNRPVARRVLVGSTPKTSVIDEAEALGYKCDLLEKIQVEAPPGSPKRKRSGSSSSGSESSTTKNRIRMLRKEQAVDEVLNFKICESLIDYTAPSTLVLASGDGAIGEFSDGFFKTVERALNRGWNVELVTFSMNVSKSYTDKAFRQHWRQQFRIINLDPFVEELLGNGPADV